MTAGGKTDNPGFTPTGGMVGFGGTRFCVFFCYFAPQHGVSHFFGEDFYALYFFFPHKRVKR